MASTVLLFDDLDRVLVVEPTYVDFMELPGGAVDLDESPRQAAIREVKEELGLDRDPGRLLAMDWVPPRPGRTEGLIAVFDGGRLTAEEIASIRLADWPHGLLEALLTEEVHRAGAPNVVAFLASTSQYARLYRRIHWRNTDVGAFLVTIAGISTGAVRQVPCRLGQAFTAYWTQRHDGYPTGTIVERLA